MPPDVTVRKTFYWTYWGSALGGGWMMIVGAVLAAWAGKNFDGTGIAELDAGRRPRLHRLRRDRAHPGRARPGLGHRAEHVRRLADADQRDRLVPEGAADARRCASSPSGFTAVLSLIGALAATENFLGELQRLPAAGPLLVHPVDRGEPGRLLRRPARPLRDRRDLQPERHVRPVGLARHPRLPRRLRRHDPVLRRRHARTRAPPPRRSAARTSRSSSGCRWRASSTTSSARSIDVAAETRVAEAEAAELEEAAQRHE